ncbi:hypothetical protein JTB14_004297 [Gonioctena quinquepunctata]|nr:hypothetical protein JTB14_004297 [Gonioctena quinquepunctata]
MRMGAQREHHRVGKEDIESKNVQGLNRRNCSRKSEGEVNDSKAGKGKPSPKPRSPAQNEAEPGPSEAEETHFKKVIKNAIKSVQEEELDFENHVAIRRTDNKRKYRGKSPNTKGFLKAQDEINDLDKDISNAAQIWMEKSVQEMKANHHKISTIPLSVLEQSYRESTYDYWVDKMTRKYQGERNILRNQMRILRDVSPSSPELVVRVAKEDFPALRPGRRHEQIPNPIKGKGKLINRPNIEISNRFGVLENEGTSEPDTEKEIEAETSRNGHNRDNHTETDGEKGDTGGPSSQNRMLRSPAKVTSTETDGGRTKGNKIAPKKAAKHDMGCTDGIMEWPHGFALGGSSIINYMIHVRGNPVDYDRWAAMGNPGWSYKDMLPYFLKSEDARIENPDEGFHRKGGYLTVSDVPFRSKSADVYVKAAQEAGHPFVDYNGRKQIGVSYVQSTTRDGRRCSAEKSFLRPARQRTNLRIQTRSRVVKILVNPESKRAYGVEYIRDGKTDFALANKEVILSAGSLNSPQILMLSGIGPKEQLKKFDIPVIQDLPVGVQMYDHATFPAIMFQLNESIVINQIEVLANPYTYYEFFKYGKGGLTSIGAVEAITYVKTNVSSDPDPTYPDVELFFVGGSLQTDFGIYYRKIFNIPPSLYDTIWKPLENKPLYQNVVEDQASQLKHTANGN